MNSKELKGFLKKHGYHLESHRGGSGHLMVLRDERRSQLPMHSGRRELPKGLVAKILKDLGIDE